MITTEALRLKLTREVRQEEKENETQRIFVDGLSSVPIKDWSEHSHIDKLHKTG